MIPKIDKSDLKITGKCPFQGSGWTNLYYAMYNGEEVIVKEQIKELDRFDRELEVLSNNIDGVVKLLAYGDKFLVLEKLYNILAYQAPAKSFLQKIATNSLQTLRKLYLLNYSWIAKPSHLLIDALGDVKLVDFNDDVYKKIPFFSHTEGIITFGMCNNYGVYLGKDVTPYSGYFATIDYYCRKLNISFEDIIQYPLRQMVEKEYQFIQNVHQPIFFPPFNEYLRRESEEDDPNFGKLVKPNRLCTDRIRLIKSALPDSVRGWSYLDIGSNVGWFVFATEFLGMESTGIEIGKRLVDFSQMIAEMNTSSAKFINKDATPRYVAQMPNYDVISLLSILHLLVPSKGKEYAISLLREICNKVNKVFFFEIPIWSYQSFGVTSVETLSMFLQKLGNFSKVQVVGMSDAKRPFIACYK